MKKQLLLGTILLSSMAMYPQFTQKFKPSGIAPFKDRTSMYSNIDLENGERKPLSPSQNLQSPTTNFAGRTSSSNGIISAVFNRVSGSMNILGSIVGTSKPLQYNDNINTVVLIHRKSLTYNASSNSNSGTMVALIGRNMATTWDSTCIWANTASLARYPQGGVYNPPGNENPNNAYVIGTGPVTGGSGWIGSWYASKKINAVGTNSPGVDQQFFSHLTPFGSATSPAMTKHYFPRYNFTSTKDGLVRTMGGLYDEYGAVTAGQPEKFRGAFIGKGTFAAGSFVWTADSLKPPVNLQTNGSRNLLSQSYMAWSESGLVGYVVFIGSRVGSTGSNVGYQPIVYKTTNSGLAWTLAASIDFNTAGWSMLKNSMGSVNTNSNLEVPWFNWNENIDVIVDKDDKLHIASTCLGSARQHQDSLLYYYQYTQSTTNDKMQWAYQPTAWPYIFDFIGDGTAAWTYKVIDSVGTESPGTAAGDDGFVNNLWANQSQTSVASADMRIQMSRSNGGEFILYSWAESDTSITTSGAKFNEFPNIHTRVMRICDGAISTNEEVVTSPTVSFNSNVRDAAYFHYVSPTSKVGAASPTSVTFTLPITVTNNTTKNGDNPVNHYYANSIATYSFASNTCGLTSIGLNAIKANTNDKSNIYPNPTKNVLNVDVSLTTADDINIDVFNAIGQKISSVKTAGQIGNNTVKMNLENVNSGVYFVKIKAGYIENTKKLIVE